MKSRLSRYENIITRIRRLSPTQLVVITYLSAASAGALLLMLPIASADGNSIPLIDALFMSTSATCVTGLVVKNPGADLSGFGQLVLLIMLQLGGLGYMTISAAIGLLLRQQIALHQQLVLGMTLGEMVHRRRLLQHVLRWTLLVEGIGFILLTIGFMRYHLPPLRALYFALFHSASAFCNAGLDVIGNSFGGLGSFRYFSSDPIITWTLAVEIILGGIGFLVVADWCERRQWYRLSLHSKLAILASITLWFGGAFLVGLFEWDNDATLGRLPWWARLQSSFFQSVTARTAGFSTIPTESLNHATLFMLVVLMFIGACPGGTGGGIKTTTASVLVATVIAALTGRRRVVIFERTIPLETVFKAVAVATLGMGIVIVATLTLSIVESLPLLSLLFETTSAFGTVGLSTGITPNLHTVSKLVLIATMLIGRIGPLTASLALLGEYRREYIRYPHEDVMIG